MQNLLGRKTHGEVDQEKAASTKKKLRFRRRRTTHVQSVRHIERRSTGVHTCPIAGWEMFELQCAPQHHQSGVEPNGLRRKRRLLSGQTAIQCTAEHGADMQSVPYSQMKPRNFAHAPPSYTLFSIQSNILCRKCSPPIVNDFQGEEHGESSLSQVHNRKRKGATLTYGHIIRHVCCALQKMFRPSVERNNNLALRFRHSITRPAPTSFATEVHDQIHPSA